MCCALVLPLSSTPAAVASLATDYLEVTPKAVRAHYEGKTGQGTDTPAGDEFKVTTKRDDDRVTFGVEKGVTVIDIRSLFGISEATIERSPRRAG